MAIRHPGPKRGLIFHSGRGRQYTHHLVPKDRRASGATCYRRLCHAKISIQCVARAAATSQGHVREMWRGRPTVLILRGLLCSV